MKKIFPFLVLFFCISIKAWSYKLTISTDYFTYANDAFLNFKKTNPYGAPMDNPLTVTIADGANVFTVQATSSPIVFDNIPTGNYDLTMGDNTYQGNGCWVLQKQPLLYHTNNTYYEASSVAVSNVGDNEYRQDWLAKDLCDPYYYPQAKDVWVDEPGAPVIDKTYNLGSYYFRGTDPDNGYTSTTNWIDHTCNRDVTIITLPTNGFILKYNGVAITTVNTVIKYTDASLLTITPGPTTPVGTKQTYFNYELQTCNGNYSQNNGTYTVNFAGAYLPVDFGSFNAALNKEQLLVNFITATETNADHFDIEVSKDGETFKKAGTVISKAKDGNSSVALEYTFTTNINAVAGLLGISFFGLALAGSILPRRRYATLFAVLSITAIAVAACNKSGTDITLDKNQKIMVRVVEYDKDGKTQYSKIITAVNQ